MACLLSIRAKGKGTFPRGCPWYLKKKSPSVVDKFFLRSVPVVRCHNSCDLVGGGGEPPEGEDSCSPGEVVSLCIPVSIP